MMNVTLLRIVLIVALLNLIYFGIEFAVALAIGSVSWRAWVLSRSTSPAYMLAAYRRHGGSLTKAAFLSTRNDAFANIAIIAAGWLQVSSATPPGLI